MGAVGFGGYAGDCVLFFVVMLGFELLCLC